MAVEAAAASAAQLHSCASTLITHNLTELCYCYYYYMCKNYKSIQRKVRFMSDTRKSLFLDECL